MSRRSTPTTTATPSGRSGATSPLRGEGAYRLAFEVEDYWTASIKRLEEHGVSYVPFDLELATGPLRVAIVDPRATKGVMFELCEPENPAYRPAT